MRWSCAFYLPVYLVNHIGKFLYVSGWGCDGGGEGAGERVGRTGTNMLNEKKMK